MYYSEFERIERMERWLERLAYLSVFLDFVVAVATYMVVRGAEYSSVMLLWSGYLIGAEVVLAAFIFVSLIGLKHYRKIVNNVALSTFRTRYNYMKPAATTALGILSFVKYVVTFPIRVFLD